MASKKGTAEVKAGEVEVQNKISAKTILGKVKRYEAATPLYVVIGIADGVRSGESDKGPWEGLTGQFEATVIAPDHANNGKRFYGTQLFLPKSGHELVAARLREYAKSESTAGQSVQFAYQVGFKPSEAAPIGYEYTVKPILKAGGADPLAQLRSDAVAMLSNQSE